MGDSIKTIALFILKNYIVIILFILFFLNCKESNQSENISSSKISELLEKAKSQNFNSFERKRYLDSVYNKLLVRRLNDSIHRYYYLNTATGFYNLDLYDSSIKVSHKGYDLAVEAKDTLAMARLTHCLAGAHYGKANNDSAFYYYGKAEKLYREINDLASAGEVILYKAYTYYNIGEYVLCESEAVKALKLLLSEKKTEHIYNCYNLIATSLEGQNNYDEAVNYFTLALKQLEVFKQEGYSDFIISLYRASCYNNLGLVYEKLELYSHAISLYSRALKMLKSEDSPSLYAKLLNNLAYAKFRSGDYSNLPDLFYQSLNIRDSLNNVSGIIASNSHLGVYYAFNKDTIKSINYLKNAHAKAQEIKSHYDILNTLKLLADIDVKNSAYYSHRYIKVNDSLQEIAKANRGKFARIEYETETLQNEKEALVKRNSLIIIGSIGALLLLVAVYVITYLSSRNKKLVLLQEHQKANEELYELMFEQQTKIEKAREEEKSRIAMELHDGILNNIYAVRLNLEFINKKADEAAVLKRKEYIKELQKVESEIRAVSHDLSRNAIFQDKDFKDILEYLITSQLNNFGTAFKANIDKNIDWEKVPNLYKINVYRIVQEGLQNINKYSQAENALVEMREEKNKIFIIIQDDGVGFDTGKAKDGIGLKNFKKRAMVLNGNVTIHSKHGEGTTIKVVLPLPK